MRQAVKYRITKEILILYCIVIREKFKRFQSLNCKLYLKLTFPGYDLAIVKNLKGFNPYRELDLKLTFPGYDLAIVKNLKGFNPYRKLDLKLTFPGYDLAIVSQFSCGEICSIVREFPHKPCTNIGTKATQTYFSYKLSRMSLL